MAINYPNFRFSEPFCSEGKKTLPPVLQNFEGSGRTSLRKGFPDECSVPPEQGGVPPDRGDMNGALNAISQWVAWFGVGGLAKWESDVSYQVGAVVIWNGKAYLCTRENLNTTPASPEFWTKLQDRGDREAVSDEIAEEVRQLRAEIKALRVGFVGEFVLSSTIDAPDRAVLCDGRSLSASDPEYALLFAKIGYKYGGSGNTFKVPDFRGLVPQGANSEIGRTVEAGLPNITGQFTGSKSISDTVKGAFQRDSTDEGNWYRGFNQGSSFYTFDASKSNPVYGKSETVQPPAMQVAIFIRY